MEDWARIARDVEANYHRYNAFIILHGNPYRYRLSNAKEILFLYNSVLKLLPSYLGTDTMSYTASGLSMMLSHLSKTVIITGSQIPLSSEPNDAIDNLR